MNAARAPRILFELRPALEGHAGIPQETRLLFRALRALDSLEVTGLLQSSLHLLPTVPAAARPDAVAQVEERIIRTLDARRGRRGELAVARATIAMALRWNLGGAERLPPFDPRRFRDYLWQRLFAKSLPATDIDLVTSGAYCVARIPWSALQICARFTAKFGPPIYPRLDTARFDAMITETPYPASVTPSTRLVVRYHDAFPLLLPHTINDRDYQQETHRLALHHNVRQGAWFACVSDATRRDLVSLFPDAERRSLTIPNMVSHHYFPGDSSAAEIPAIVAAHRVADARVAPVPAVPFDYLLMVSSIEPRKNHLALIAAWEELCAGHFPHLKLVAVGGPGWRNESILHRLQPWLERGAALLLRNVPADSLRRLYAHARATVCPSIAEGFDYSGVEAMRSGGVVVASDIPVHREIFADAAEYFGLHDASDLAQALRRVLADANAPRRRELVERGAVVAARYLPDAVQPQWRAFLGGPATGT
jgi:glycosyltransferase involved in cell wall biosynthesis